MKINDNVYGTEEINEPVLVDLINSKAVQRLKGISQYGMPPEYYHKISFSRYDHSIGVLILLRRLNAELKEQIAGLLHDVSHTAFSHVVDWFLGDPTKEDYQDKNHLKIIEESDIPLILERYGLNFKEIVEVENFSLLEKNSPSLCVDRIDYTLREMIQDEKIEDVKKIYGNLKNFNGQVIFLDEDIAKIFAENYIKLQKEHWAGDQARARYHLLSEILRIAIEDKTITMGDLKKTDEEVIKKLLGSNNEAIHRRLKLLKNGFNIFESNQGIELRKKFRYVDPEVLSENKINVLSKISKDYLGLINKEKLDSNLFKKIIIAEK